MIPLSFRKSNEYEMNQINGQFVQNQYGEYAIPTPGFATNQASKVEIHEDNVDYNYTCTHETNVQNADLPRTEKESSERGQPSERSGVTDGSEDEERVTENQHQQSALQYESMTKPKQDHSSSVQLYPGILATPETNNKEYAKANRSRFEGQNGKIQQRIEYNSVQPKEVKDQEEAKVDPANVDMIMMLQ